MQGINRKIHLEAIKAMFKLENLAIELALGDEVVLEIHTKRIALENHYKLYLDVLNKVALQIAEYEDLFAELKVRYTASRVKKMKKVNASNSIS